MEPILGFKTHLGFLKYYNHTISGLHIMVLENQGNSLKHFQGLLVPFEDYIPHYYLHIIEPT